MSSHSNRPDAGDRTEDTDRPNVLTESPNADTQDVATTDDEATRDTAPGYADTVTTVAPPDGRDIRVAALQAETDLLRAERESLESQVDSLEAEVASLESEVASLERTLSDARAETERVRQRYEYIIEQKERAYQQETASADALDGLSASLRAGLGAVADRLRRLRRE